MMRGSIRENTALSVVFGTNLGPAGLAHRGSLNANFTACLKNRTTEKAEHTPNANLEESLRVVEDALCCVENVEFMGQRSRPYVNNREGADGSFCSMPVKLTFGDRDSRINFERTLRDHTGLRAVQSLPEVIRKEMTAFRKALEQRYQGRIIMVRPNSKNLELNAFMKEDGAPRWTPCSECHTIPIDIMLPSFRETTSVTLPDMEVDPPAAGEGDGDATDGR